MLFSTSNAFLVTALALNVASTFGAPIPLGDTGDVDARAANTEHESRYLDILVPKKRFRSWNKTRRAARENVLRAIRHAESRAAALAEGRESIGRRHPLPYSASDFLDRDLVNEERGEVQQIGRRYPTPYSADDLDDLFERALDEELEEMHARSHKKKKGPKTKGKAHSFLSMVDVVSLNTGHVGGGEMCPCASAPPPMKKPCPEHPGTPAPGQPGSAPLPGQPGAAPGPGQPGFGGSGNSSSPSITFSAPGSTSTGTDGSGGDGSGDGGNSTTTFPPSNSTGPPDTGSGDGGNSTTPATGPPSNSTGIPDLGSSDGGNSTSPAAGPPSNSTGPPDTGSGDDGNSTATATSAFSSSTGTPDASSAGSNSTGPPGDDGTGGNSTTGDDGTGNSTSTNSSASDYSLSDSNPEGRSLFEHWVSRRTAPVRRVNSARFQPHILGV